MAFFNLTQLGVQDPIRAALRDDKSAAENDGRNGTVNVNLTAQQEGGCKSYVKYTERLTKHQRSPKDPNEIYSKPVTSSQEYGWWKKDGAPKSLPWTEAQRHSRVNSEMTRFVDEMTLTNKHFTLF